MASARAARVRTLGSGSLSASRQPLSRRRLLTLFDSLRARFVRLDQRAPSVSTARKSCLISHLWTLTRFTGEIETSGAGLLSGGLKPLIRSNQRARRWSLDPERPPLHTWVAVSACCPHYHGPFCCVCHGAVSPGRSAELLIPPLTVGPLCAGGRRCLVRIMF